MSSSDKTKLNNTTGITSGQTTKLANIEAGAQVNPGAATTSATGLLSADDKTRLDALHAHPRIVACGKVGSNGTPTKDFGITTSRTSTGLYKCTFITARADSNYGGFLTVNETSNRDDVITHVVNGEMETTDFDVVITEQDNSGAAGVPINKTFFVQVVDNILTP